MQTVGVSKIQTKTYIDEYEKVDENKLKELIKYPKIFYVQMYFNSV